MRFILHSSASLLLFGAACLSMPATVFFNDSFSYDDGALSGQGVWARGPNVDNPSDHIAVSSQAVLFDWTTTTALNNLVRGLWDAADPGPVSTGTVYAIFDLTVTSPPVTTGNLRPGFFSFGNPTGSAQRGFVGLKPGSQPGTFRLGVSPNSQLQANYTFSDQDLNLNETYQVMVGFTIGTAETSLWIGTTDPADPPVATRGLSSYSAVDIRRVNLRLNNADGSGGTTNLGVFSFDNLTVTTLPGPAEEGPFALTVSSTTAGKTPSRMGVNLGHFLEGSNALPRIRYLEGNLARVFLNASHFLSKPLNRYDQPLHGDGVASFELFLQRREWVRSDPVEGPWINWDYYEQRWAEYRTTGSNQIDAPYAVEALRDSGHEVLIQSTLSPAHMPFESDDDWAGRWEYWKYYYAFSFMMARDYGITRFQMYNEPDHAASGLSDDLPGYLNRLLLASDAIQSGVADAAELTGEALRAQVYAPVTAGFRPEWAEAALNLMSDSILPSGGFSKLFQHFTWQSYGLTSAAFGDKVREVDTFVKNRLDGESLPLALSEFNVHTARSFSEMEATLDTPSRFARLAGIYASLINEGMDTLAIFKFSQTAANDTIGIRKNGLHYTENEEFPLNVGGITSGGEVARLFNRGFKGGRNRLDPPMSQPALLPDVYLTAAHSPASGKRFLAIANQRSSALKWDLDLTEWLGEADGLAVVHEVSAGRPGSIAKSFLVRRGAIEELRQPSESLWLIEVAPLAGWWSETVLPAAVSNPRAGDFSQEPQPGGEVLLADNPSDIPDGRRAAVLSFTLPSSQGHRLDHAAVKLHARGTGPDQTAHLYAMAAGPPPAIGYSWAAYPHLRPSAAPYATPSIAATAVIEETDDLYFLGTLRVTSEWEEYSFDLTNALAALSGSHLEILAVRELRDPSNYDLNTGAVEIRGTGTDGPALSLHHRPARFFSESYASWIAAEQIAPDAAAPGDDPDGSGLPNILAYALGLNGSERSVAQLPQALFEAEAEGGQRLSMRLAAPRDNVLYEVEASENLREWSGDDVVMEGPDSMEMLYAWTPLPQGRSGRLFLRLRVSPISEE